VCGKNFPSSPRCSYSRAILDDAKVDGLIADNPATRVQRPRVARKEARHLDASQFAAVLAGAEGLRYRPVLVLIAASGLRRRERVTPRRGAGAHVSFGCVEELGESPPETNGGI
jgi:site-specific recombinase XerC